MTATSIVDNEPPRSKLRYHQLLRTSDGVWQMGISATNERRFQRQAALSANVYGDANVKNLHDADYEEAVREVGRLNREKDS